MGKFKIGDRVRFVKGNALADATGTIVGNGDGYYAWSVRLDKRSVDFGHTCDGLVDDFFGRYAKDADLEPIAATPQLTIRAGAYYKTRDGRKVGPMEVQSNDMWPIRAAGTTDTENEWRVDGRWQVSNPPIDHSKDLIAEWVDEPAVEEPKFKVGDRVKFVDDYGGPARGKEATVVKLGVWGEGKGVQVDQGGKWGISTEHAHSLRLVAPATSGKRNFRKGDRVRCLEDYPHQFTAGKIYTVSRDHEGLEYENVSVELDDNGSMSNGWNPNKFELVTSTPAIVALIKNGRPKPATYPFVHPDREAAAKEAKRLAGQHKGKEFGVYELVDTAKEAKVYEHEWQRLAVSGQKIAAIKEVRSATGFTLKGAKDAVEHWLAVEAA